MIDVELSSRVTASGQIQLGCALGCYRVQAGREVVVPGAGWWVPMSSWRLMVLRRIGGWLGLSHVIWAVAGSE
jgi:hypothetical protein